MREKVLILEVDGYGQEALRALLSGAGYDAECVADLEAFDKALTWWKPRVVVVQLGVPGKSGLEVVRELKARPGASVKTVLMAAMVPESLAALAAQAGADASYSTLDGYAGVLTCVRNLLAAATSAGFDPGVDW